MGYIRAVNHRTRRFSELLRPAKRGLETGSRYRVIWRPQRDEDTNGIPAEFVIALDGGRAPAKARDGKRTNSDGRKRSKDRAS